MAAFYPLQEVHVVVQTSPRFTNTSESTRDVMVGAPTFLNCEVLTLVRPTEVWVASTIHNCEVVTLVSPIEGCRSLQPFSIARYQPWLAQRRAGWLQPFSTARY
jgi:hypothetical protein